jgi:hypothetical protein
LFQQDTRFTETMWNQFLILKNPLEYGAITTLWTILGSSQHLQENISEYFKIVDLWKTMILGSVEDDRMFNGLPFFKSKMRNRLDKHLDICLRLYVTRYETTNFLYESALAL